MLSIFAQYLNKIAVPGLVIFLMILSACNPRESVPKDFPDKEEMANILADLYWTESVITNDRGRLNEERGEDQVPGYYRKVMEKYGLTSSRFDTIREWYAAHPYHYQDVYEETIVILSKREADFNKKLKEQKELEDTSTVLKDLWTKDRTLRITPADTSNLKLPFQVELDSLLLGQIRFTGFYKFLRPDMTRDAHIEMVSVYSDSTMDTVLYDLSKTFKNKSFSLLQPIDTTDTVVQISGFLFDHDSTSRAAVEFSKIKLEHLGVKKDSVEEKRLKDLPELRKKVK